MVTDHSYVSKAESHNSIPLCLKDSDPYINHDTQAVSCRTIFHFSCWSWSTLREAQRQEEEGSGERCLQKTWLPAKWLDFCLDEQVCSLHAVLI